MHQHFGNFCDVDCFYMLFCSKSEDRCLQHSDKLKFDVARFFLLFFLFGDIINSE